MPTTFSLQRASRGEVPGEREQEQVPSAVFPGQYRLSATPKEDEPWRSVRSF